MNGGNFICIIYDLIYAIRVPLTIVSILFIGIAKIASPYFPEAAQRYGRMFRDVIMGVVIILGASWIVELLFGETFTGCG